MKAPSAVVTALDPAARAALLARLDESVDSSGGPDACHPWTGGIVQHGYGLLHVYVGGVRRLVKAHRLVYEAATGEAPETVDHLCHDHETCDGGDTCPHRLCCNSAHLGPAGRGKNASRARLGKRNEMCRNGLHLMVGDNVYETPEGRRTCRACQAAGARRRRSRQQQGAGPHARTYRPRGMDAAALVEWGLAENDDPDACWRWRNALHVQRGYIEIKYDGRQHSAHRLVYEVLVGPIPDGCVVDHICHDPRVCEGGDDCPHRRCMNPRHLTAVTPKENLSAQRSAGAQQRAVCKRGHEFTEGNTYVAPGTGKRRCRACMAQGQRDRRAAVR